MTLSWCSDVSPAKWFTSEDTDPGQLAVFGPACFGDYARLRFIPDPTYPGQREGEVDVEPDASSDADQFAVLLRFLAGYTTTPDDCYFCIWDGFTAFETPLIKTAAIVRVAGETMRGIYRDVSYAPATATPPLGAHPATLGHAH